MLFNTKTNDLITSTIGSFEILNDRRKNSGRTGVIEVLTNERKRFFIKVYNRLSRWNPEVYAYKHWTEPLGRYAPKLIAAFNDDDTFGIIITPIQGKTVNEMQITDNEILTYIYYEAGQLFKKMQTNKKGDYFGIPNEDGSPYDSESKTDPVIYVSDSIESLFKSAYDNKILDSFFEPLIKWCLNNCYIFKDEFPVPTNWDLSQNNWIVDEDGNFAGFIDFENMLWGISLDSFAVITERYTYDKPFLEKSFFEGYGLGNDEIINQKKKIISVKASIGNVCYGHMIKNQRFFDCGIRMLRNIAGNHIQ